MPREKFLLRSAVQEFNFVPPRRRLDALTGAEHHRVGAFLASNGFSDDDDDISVRTLRKIVSRLAFIVAFIRIYFNFVKRSRAPAGTVNRILHRSILFARQDAVGSDHRWYVEEQKGSLRGEEGKGGLELPT